MYHWLASGNRGFLIISTMEEIRINAQKDIIENVNSCMKEVSIGIGFKTKVKVTTKKGIYSDTLIIKPKKGKVIDPSDLFWIGYHTGKEY